MRLIREALRVRSVRREADRALVLGRARSARAQTTLRSRARVVMKSARMIDRMIPVLPPRARGCTEVSEPSRLTLKAPLSGVVVPLGEVPDPVFAQKMVGDGVSIDPISASLVAPCDGRVVQIHSAAHAVTLASSQGVDT